MNVLFSVIKGAQTPLGASITKRIHKRSTALERSVRKLLEGLTMFDNKCTEHPVLHSLISTLVCLQSANVIFPGHTHF